MRIMRGFTWTRTAVAACLAASLSSCAATPKGAQTEDTAPVPAGEVATKRYRYIGKAMGSRVELTVDEDANDAGKDRARAAAKAALDELDRLDGILSDWKRGSELTAFNLSRDARRDMSPEFCEVLARALDIARATDGLFDPTIAPSVHLWRESRASLRLPSDSERASACALVDWRRVKVEGSIVGRLRNDVTVDFGGIGKGYGAVRAVAAMRAAGCMRTLAAVAGDIAAGDAPRGAGGWEIEIAPEAAGVAAESISLANAAISTSGGSMQWVEIGGTRYAHIVDPRTGLGATDLAQVTVVGPLDCAVDALGTALALTHDDLEAARIMEKFAGYRARIERHGAVAWIGDTTPGTK
jgi:thiamine biosynthesis lipoprotein